MPENWKTYKLSELVSLLGDGIHGTPQYSENGEYYFINGNNLVDGNILIKPDTKRVSKDEYLKHKRNLNDRTLLVSINGTIGRAAYYNEEKVMLGKSACYFNIKDDVSKEFIKHVISSKYFIDYLESNFTGSVIKNVSLKSMRDFPIELPPLHEQKAIASILSALDDKIELNLQMNKTLEEMAMALYKHWFTDFGPFQNGKFIESELGMIPEGWEVKRLEEVTRELRRGISPNYTEEEGINVLNQRCIRRHEVDFSFARKHNINKKKVEGRLLEIGDILVNSTGVGTLGRMAPIIELKADTVVDSHVTVVRVNTEKFLLHNFSRLMLHIEPIVEAMGEGSTGQTELSRVSLGELNVLVPPLNEQYRIEGELKLYTELLANNLNKNQTLTTLRDTLLPKLISGAVRVKDIEPNLATAL